MKEYNVVFHYSVRVEADDEDDAQDKAWVLYGDDDCPQENFFCTVEPIVDVWDTNDEGDYTCVDCEELVSDEFVCGNREYSEPRCEDCYETHRYRS